MQTPTPAVLRPRDAAAYIGIGLSTLWKRTKAEPDFPRPRKLSPRVTVFLVSDLDDLVARSVEG